MSVPVSSSKPLPEFVGITMGASREEARAAMEVREGVRFSPDESGTENLVFTGGLFAQKDVKQWVLQFVDDQLHTAKALIIPPPAIVMREFYDLKARYDREYGEPAQGGVIVNPPYREGQELEAIVAGKGIAMCVYTFGTSGRLDGSILLQVTPQGTILTNFQHEGLNRKALSGLTGIDAPVSASGPGARTGQSGGGCFIATAALGSYDHPSVITLRRYRDTQLLTTWTGRRFVDAYYFASPPFARLISRSELLKSWACKLIVLPALKIAKGQN